jgi:hypothetical protein
MCGNPVEIHSPAKRTLAKTEVATIFSDKLKQVDNGDERKGRESAFSIFK